jgi:hypothetical protein
LDHALDPAIEALTILLRQVFRGDHHHREVLPVRASAQRVDELEAIHRRHHQVENNHIRLPVGEQIDGDPAVLRLRHLPADRLQRLPHAAPHHLVVVDQKYAARARAADVSQRLHKRGTVDRLHQIVGCAERVTAVLLVDDRHQYHRDTCELRVALDRGQHGPAVEVGHHDVERDRRRPQLPHQPKPFLAAARRDRREAAPFQVPHHELAHGLVVVHDQDQRLFCFLGDGTSALRAFRSAPRRCRRFAHLRDARQADGEGRALPRLAFDGDLAAHQAAEMLADGEAEAGATILAGGRGIGLRKFLEQPAHLLLGHADAGVCDRDPDRVAAIERLRLRGDGHGALLGELVGIAG